MRKFFVLSSAVVLVAVLTTPNAFAQRDAGSKARGDMTDFWGRRTQRASSRGSANMRANRVLPSAVESYRSFSYVPAAPSLSAGDAVVVANDDTKLMSGRDVVASVPRGTAFTVTNVTNGWLGAVVEIDGKKANGWIRNSDVRAADLGAVVEQEPAQDVQIAAQPSPAVQQYRSFSYQPSASRGETHKHAWQYPKTDPRRYHP
jgi:hypothetical protein